MSKINFEKLKGTDFQKKVWQEILKIPKGKTITYKELAKKIKMPKAFRAVANAVGSNPLLIAIPCHRVVRSDGTLGGYSGKGGTKAKYAILKKEGVDLTFIK
jgi:methylated-DNA-[protein]-cysteine S-methyltransferase